MSYNKTLKKIGDQIAESETSKWKCRNYERDSIYEIAKNLKEPMLEIGPGYGRLMKRLLASGIKDITGLELSQNLAKIQKEIGFKSIIGNVIDIPIQNNSYNTVIIEQVIEHVVDQEKAMSEILRILNSGGKLILSTPNKFIYRFLMYISNVINWQWSWGLLKNPTPGHVSECTLNRLLEIHKDFVIDKIIPVNPYLPQRFLNKYPRFAINFIILSHKK